MAVAVIRINVSREDLERIFATTLEHRGYPRRLESGGIWASIDELIDRSKRLGAQWEVRDIGCTKEAAWVLTYENGRAQFYVAVNLAYLDWQSWR